MKSFTAASISSYPPCLMDISFWLPEKPGKNVEVDFCELVRECTKDLGNSVQTVKLIDSYKCPKTRRTSLCFRLFYQSYERTLTRSEVSKYHEAIRFAVEHQLGGSDNNGLISKQGLLEAMEAFGGNLSRIEIRKIFGKIDTDKSGDIDFTEFIQAIALPKKTKTIWTQTPHHMRGQSDTAADPKLLFNIFDTNLDGSISPDEIREVMFYELSPIKKTEMP
ncbi:hypothetical protein ACOME3_003755 [Neoechinorhynchus agilis]